MNASPSSTARLRLIEMFPEDIDLLEEKLGGLADEPSARTRFPDATPWA